MGLLIYAGTGNGVIAITRDDQGKWGIRPRRCLPEWEVTELVMDDAGRLIVGTRGDGVWRQTDTTWDGRTGGWKKPNWSRIGPGKVHCVTVDPRDPKTIYAGTEPIGIWITHDGGESWSRLDSLWDIPGIGDIWYPVPSVEPHVRDITIDPADSNILYAALQVGYFAKSIDRGKTWRLITKGIDADVHTFVIDPRDNRHIYAATGGHGHRKGETAGKALYVSSDAGESWQPMASEFEQDYAVPLVMHPTNPDILISAVGNGPPPWRRPTGAEARIILSKDGGRSWKAIETPFKEIGEQFPGSFAFDPQSPNEVYMCIHKGGFFHSSDCGETWERVPLDLAGFGGLMERGLSDMQILHV